MKPQLQTQTIVIIILAVGLSLLACYVVIDKYAAAQEEAHESAFQDGLEQGYNIAVLQIAQQAAAGQQVPLILGNQTVNIISVETCLKALEEN